jgi:hypothetical protein
MPMKCLICADREPDRPAVCDPCRLWLPNELRDIAEEYAAPTVPALVRWLTVRCGWACDEHPAVDDFADEMRELLAELRRANEDGPVYAEPIKAVPCSGCDAVALFRPVKSSYRAECGMCGKLYTDDEYGRWTGLLAAQAQAKGRVA